MIRAIVVTLAGLAACWAVWAVGRMAVAEQTAGLPASETHLTQGAQERLAAVSTAVQAARAQQVKSEPVTYRTTIKPPREVMAARTGVTMSTAWKFSASFPNAGTHLAAGAMRSGIAGAGLGVYGILETIGTELVAPHEHEPNIGWFGEYLLIRVLVSAPGMVSSQALFSYWLRDVSGPEQPTPPPSYTVITSLPATEFTCSTTGVYLKRARTHTPPDDRSLMDPTDSAITDTWYADENATATISALCPDGSTISATGTFENAGEEVLFTALGIRFDFTLVSAPYVGVVEELVSGVSWDQTSIDLSKLDLYNPGSNPPDSNEPDWGRTQTTTDCWRIGAGSLALWRQGGSDGNMTWGGEIGLPYILTLTPVDAKFDAAGPAYGIDYTSNFVTYTGETTYTVDTFSDVYGPIVSGGKSWEYEWEWRKLSSAAIQVRETTAWRTTNNEDVGDSTETQNDARAVLCACGLTASDCTSEPYWSSGFGFSLASSIDINDTQGLPARASPWVAGSGVTVDPVDNDLWTVAAGASSPAVTRSMATRYWLRMNRLSSGYTPGLEYHPDWPIMLKANLPILTTEDDTDWWDSGLGGVDSEDITNWANRRYLLLGITAARAGTVRLTVTYKVPHPSDPCYTCADHRWGEWSYTTTTYTRSYDVAVEAGANSKLVDLILNREKSSVTGSYRMHQVTSVSIALPANPSGSPEAYTLTGLALVLDPGETGRDEPATHSAFRFVPSWAWIGTRWFGYGGWVDGKDALELEYGYSSQHYETKLAYIAHSAHCPESELTSRLDAAKAIGRLYNELSWQEGVTPTWPTPTPENNSNNKDADDAQVDSSLYWWDIRQSNEGLTLSNLSVALVAGTYNIAAGVPYNIRFPKFPRGALHGIAVNPAYTAVQRNATDLIDVYQALGGTTRVAQLDTDEHGRYRFDEAYEKTALYRLDGGGELSGWLPVANREYTTATVECAQYTPVHPCLAEGYMTDLHLAFVSEGMIYYRRRPAIGMAWEAAASVVAGDYPCIVIPPDNCPVMCYETSGNTAWLRTQDHGLTWEAVGMATSGLYPMAAEANGIQYLVTYTSGVGHVIRRSQDYFSTLLGFGTATSALVVADGSCNAERVGFLKLDAGGRMLWTAVPDGSRVNHYGSYDDGATWVSL
jgi:hypothetical protein